MLQTKLNQLTFILYFVKITYKAWTVMYTNNVLSENCCNILKLWHSFVSNIFINNIGYATCFKEPGDFNPYQFIETTVLLDVPFLISFTWEIKVKQLKDILYYFEEQGSSFWCLGYYFPFNKYQNRLEQHNDWMMDMVKGLRLSASEEGDTGFVTQQQPMVSADGISVT